MYHKFQATQVWVMTLKSLKARKYFLRNDHSGNVGIIPLLQCNALVIVDWTTTTHETV